MYVTQKEEPLPTPATDVQDVEAFDPFYGSLEAAFSQKGVGCFVLEWNGQKPDWTRRDKATQQGGVGDYSSFSSLPMLPSQDTSFQESKRYSSTLDCCDR